MNQNFTEIDKDNNDNVLRDKLVPQHTNPCLYAEIIDEAAPLVEEQIRARYELRIANSKWREVISHQVKNESSQIK